MKKKLYLWNLQVINIIEFILIVNKINYNLIDAHEMTSEIV